MKPIPSKPFSSAACRLALLLASLLMACQTTPDNTPHMVLVSQAGSSNVVVVDPKTGTVQKRIVVGALPHRFLQTQNGLYVVLVGSQAVAEINKSTLEVKRTFLTAPVPSTRSNGTVIAAHVAQNAAAHSTCFDCHHDQTGAAKPFVVGERPVGLAASSDEKTLLVSHVRKSLLSSINAATGEITRSVSLAPTGTANEAVDVARVGERFVVALRPSQPSNDAGVLRWLDASTLMPLGESVTGSDPSMVLPMPNRDSVLVSNFESNTVAEHRLGATPTNFAVTPGPLGATRLPDGRVLTLNYYSNSVSILNLEQHQTQTTALVLNGQTFVNPTHAALSPDARVAYIVSSGTNSHLLFFDLQSLRVLRAVPIDGLSFDVVVVQQPTP